MSALSALFSGLDRLGPGNAESVRWALGVAGTPKTARILDAGCGTGADLGVLNAAAANGQLVAIDREVSFVERARKRVPGIEVAVADMAHPPGAPFDLIWSAGAVYNLGVANALAGWRNCLTRDGCVAFSDLRARIENPPTEVIEFWASEGVDLQSTAMLEAEVIGAGYEILGTRWVGTAGWASYYGPLEVELDHFDADPDLAAALRAEIALWRTHGVTYGYRIIVARPMSAATREQVGV